MYCQVIEKSKALWRLLLHAVERAEIIEPIRAAARQEAKGRGWQSECAQQLNLLMSLYERNKVFYGMKRL